MIRSTMLVVLLAVSQSCGNRTTTESPDGSVKVTEDSGVTKMVVDSKDGKTTMLAGETGIEIPETFPKDVPIPTGAVPKVYMYQVSSPPHVLHLAVVAGTYAAAAKDYQAKLKDQGWEIETTKDMGEGAMITAKKEKRGCSFMVGKDDEGGVMIQVAADGKATMLAGETGIEIPETFPKDVPIPKDAVPKVYMYQVSSHVLHLAFVAGPYAAAAKDYQAKLKDQGWEIETIKDMGEGAMITAKKEKRSCGFMVGKDDEGGVMIQLTVAEQ